MARGVFEVYTPATVIRVDLTNTSPLRIGCILNATLSDARQAGIKLILADKKGIVLAWKLNPRLHIMQRDLIGDVHGKEKSGGPWGR